MSARRLLVVADDFGIGPETSRGILDLMRAGVVTGTVLLVNAPTAEDAVRRWRAAGGPGDLGWHPNLNLDRPVSAPGAVASLVCRGGGFAPLGVLMARLATGGVRYRELVRELDAQLGRYRELVGADPALINGHKHVHVFPLVRRALAEVLAARRLRPYVRRVIDPVSCLWGVPGARGKRLFLGALGAWAARRQRRAGFPGNDALAGITDPRWVRDPQFFARWLARVPGRVVELAVHPGHRDETLIGRDCTATDGQVQRRTDEQALLSAPEFARACAGAGFDLCRPSRAWDLRTEAARAA
ncbi:ChbG/HpnK family deacetylase [Gemmata sp. JC717]|uniref:carbohydrate deacetylase n=1 Tax=Gemmata algarum TaxID=2975278 RepID=UPI0021BB22D3|nr:ChbG/HpnK family deacetylase [Gemmata algarum]MDY3555176.1 ChbG/HpnK family deacetylase [Gemmata algarum]